MKPKKLKPLFHRISTKRFKEFEKEGRTWGWLMKKYRQPDWCTYYEALGGIGGCWSLTLQGKKRIRKKADCGNCDCIRKEAEK